MDRTGAAACASGREAGASTGIDADFDGLTGSLVRLSICERVGERADAARGGLAPQRTSSSSSSTDGTPGTMQSVNGSNLPTTVALRCGGTE
jgi:hypothetical protein